MRAIGTLVPNDFSARGEIGAAGHERAPFAAHDVLGGVEAEAGDISKGTGKLAAIGGEQGLCRVFYQQEMMRRRDLLESMHLGTDARVVDNEDCPGARGNRRVDQALIHIERVRTDVDKNRRRPT